MSETLSFVNMSEGKDMLDNKSQEHTYLTDNNCEADF